MPKTEVGRDYYTTLGISRAASKEDIKAAYRTLSKSLHPDLNGGDAHKTAEFKQVHEAYTTLFDEQSRQRYDSTERNQQQYRAATEGKWEGMYASRYPTEVEPSLEENLRHLRSNTNPRALGGIFLEDAMKNEKHHLKLDMTQELKHHSEHHFREYDEEDESRPSPYGFHDYWHQYDDNPRKTIEVELTEEEVQFAKQYSKWLGKHYNKNNVSKLCLEIASGRLFDTETDKKMYERLRDQLHDIRRLLVEKTMYLFSMTHSARRHIHSGQEELGDYLHWLQSLSDEECLALVLDVQREYAEN